MPETVTLHRIIATPPEKIYRAFLEPDALANWLPPYGFLATVRELEAKVGGIHAVTFRNFTTGNSHSFRGVYHELVPDTRLVYTDTFDDPNMPGEMRVTVDLKKISAGTDLSITQDGIPDMIPTEFCYLGWQESLDKLARLVLPEINDG